LSLVERGKSRISLRALAIVARRLELPISYFLEDQTEGPTHKGELIMTARIVRQDAESVTVELDLRSAS
jgi:transcriptional regulator with XRE-family HTH domain